MSTPEQSSYLSLLRKRFMKGRGLVQRFFHGLVKVMYNEVLAFINKLGLRLAHNA